MSAKIPKGWRAMREGEILCDEDLLLLDYGRTIPVGIVIGDSVIDQSQSQWPYIRRIKTPKPAPAKSPAEILVDSIARRHKKSLAEIERLAIAAVRKAVFARRHAADVREFKSKCMKGKK